MKCSCCGTEIGSIAFDKSCEMPDEIWDLREEEKTARAQIASDLCRLDERYFLRGVAYVPVNGTEELFGWGIWAEVQHEYFLEYVKNYAEDISAKPQFPGTVANHIPPYEGTIGLKLQVQLGNASQRPTFIFTACRHPLAIDQASGTAIEKVHSFNNL